MNKMIRHKSKKSGFTILELLIASAIFILAGTGLMSLFISYIQLNEINRNTMLAYVALQSKMEEIKSTPFDNIKGIYNGAAFNMSGFDPSVQQAKVLVTNDTPQLLRIEINACFKNRNITIGNNISNCLASPVSLATYISK